MRRERQAILLTRRILLAASLVANLGLLLRCTSRGARLRRPVRIVILFAGGGPDGIHHPSGRGSPDSHARAGLRDRKPGPGGAGGTVGAKSVAVAEPDGYTLPVQPAPGLLGPRPPSTRASTTIRSGASAPIAQWPSTHRRCWWCIPRCRRIRCRSSSPMPRAIRARSLRSSGYGSAAAHARRDVEARGRHRHHPHSLSRRGPNRHGSRSAAKSR